MAVTTRKRAASRQNGSRILLRNSTVSQWGNCLGVRIPQEAAEKLQLKAGEQVQMEVSHDAITIRALRQPRKWSLSDLLKGVKPEKAGAEFNWGNSVGKESL